MSGRYEFHAERLTAAIKAASGGVVEEVDLEENWDDVVSDGSEWALLITEEDLPVFVSQIADLAAGPDPRHGTWHAEARDRLREHDDCASAIKELRAERDDVVTSITWARDHLFNDIYEGEYGDLYVDSEPLLNLLRPTLRGDGKWRHLLPPEECAACWGTQFGHEEECSTEARVEELDERREHLVATHLHCEEIGAALIAHTARCLSRVEEIAARIHDETEQVAGSEVVRPHSILHVAKIADLNVPLDHLTPAVLGAAIFPELEDEDYCREEPFHSTPHRACRYLVS
jgi:hypothetical protein